MKEKVIVLTLIGLAFGIICLAYLVGGSKFGMIFFLPAYACIEEAVNAWKKTKRVD